MVEFPKNLQRVGMYLRKSRADVEAESRGEGETLRKHRTALLQLAALHGYTILDTFEEIVSGERILDRPEMQRLLTAVQSKTFDGVLCMDMDRLGRGNLIDQGLIQETFKTTNTLIITPRKVYNLGDEMDEEWSEFEAFMARRELKVITRRMQRGRRQSASLGKHISKQPPYGYVRDEHLRLHVHPETGPIVSTIFELAADGMGMGSIANYLTELGIPTPSGKAKWHRATIYDILHNPVYQGRIVWGRTKYSKSTHVAGTYHRQKSAPEDWLVSDQIHTPLVTPDTYQRFVHRQQSYPSIPRNQSLSNPLAALVYCAECGKAMMRQPARQRPSNRILCKTHQCPTRSARFELVESRLLQVLQNTLQHWVISLTDVVPGREHALQSLDTVLQKQVQRSMNTITLLQQQQSALYDFLEQGVYDIHTFQTRCLALEQRLEEAQRTLTLAQEEFERAEIQHVPTKSIQSEVCIVDVYNTLQTVEEKNQFLRSFIERIVYHRGSSHTTRDAFVLEVTLRF